VFPIAIAANGFNMQALGWRFVSRALARPDRRLEHVLDLGSLLMHYAVFVALPMLWFAPADVLLVYVLRIALVGYAMFAILAPGHYPAEALRVHAGVPIDALALQTGATINFRTGRLGRLVCSGLEYQIEHHLFPDVSHVYLPAVSVAVRDLCVRRGLPYRCYSWPVAIWKSWKIVFQPGRVHSTMASLRWDS
jgi:fatty acid desaturase